MEPNDTSPTAQRQQIELLRKLTPGQRAALALRLSDSAIALSRRAIQRAHPDWTDLEVKIEWARLHYGEEIARRIEAWAASRE